MENIEIRLNNQNLKFFFACGAIFKDARGVLNRFSGGAK